MQRCMFNMDMHIVDTQLAEPFPSTTDEAVQISKGEPRQKGQTVTTFRGLQHFLPSVDQFVQYFNYLAVL